MIEPATADSDKTRMLTFTSTMDRQLRVGSEERQQS